MAGARVGTTRGPRHPGRRLAELAVALGGGLGLVSAFLGWSPVSIEADGVFVYCGRVLFTRRATLPAPSCRSAFSPLDRICFAGLLVAAVLVLGGISWLIVTARKRHGGRGGRTNSRRRRDELSGC